MARPARSVRSLDQAFDPVANGVTVLRLSLALLVIFSHTYKVGGFGFDPGEVLSNGRTEVGRVAVSAFMVLSGFLVTRSREHSGPLGFAWRRFLRVMPGFWVCLVLTVLLIAPLGAAIGGTQLLPGAGLDYLAGNGALLHTKPFIPDVFATNPYPLTVNASIWTLAPEVACYLGILCIPGRFLKLAAPGLTVALGVIHALRMTGAAPDAIALDFPFAFALGGSAWLFRDRLPMHGALAAIGVAGVLASLYASAFIAVGIPFLAYLVLWLAVTIRKPIETDLSYGVYIYAFPMQQLAAAAGFAALGFVPLLVVGTALALGAGWLSWHLIERSALSLKGLSRRSLWSRLRPAGVPAQP